MINMFKKGDYARVTDKEGPWIHTFPKDELVVIYDIEDENDPSLITSYTCQSVGPVLPGATQVLAIKHIKPANKPHKHKDDMKVYKKTSEEKYRDKLEIYYNIFLKGFYKRYSDIPGYHNGVILRVVYDSIFGYPYDRHPKHQEAKEKNMSFKNVLTNTEFRSVCYRMADYVKDPMGFLKHFGKSQHVRLSIKLNPFDEKLYNSIYDRLIKQFKSDEIEKAEL